MPLKRLKKLMQSRSTTLTCKYLFLGWFGGSFYVSLEVFWRERSHWTMFVLAACLFIILGLLNEIWSWSLLTQCLVGAMIATTLEFIAGCVLNLWLGWDIWDYSNVFGNVLGQICLPFSLLWVALSALAIVLDDVIRWKFFNENKPNYRMF